MYKTILLNKSTRKDFFGTKTTEWGNLHPKLGANYYVLLK